METHFELNEVTKKLPKHLHKFIVKQPYDDYTAQNQAVWRYVMRANVDYLSRVAHSSYVNGLEKTGISVESIPRMEGMNRILKEIGWAAVSVDGFIPPNAFMEFQAYNVLVIASDMRTINHIEYTPAPDIIHEAAGHAPIIANPEYAEYLRRFGALGAKAIASAKDYELYEAVRLLSILKEDPNSTEEEIKNAEENIEQVQNTMGEPSEMAKIRNLHWWTVEYGLIGELDDPKIYGAGLLSSIGESKSCLEPSVKKIPYTIEASEVSFDITKTQPQLFVTPDFAHLSMVLEEFADTMAIRTGGANGLQKLIDSKSLGTIEMSSGVQVTGVFSNMITDNENNPIYIQTKGGTSLSYRGKELIGHGTNHHKEGFGSPVGKLMGVKMPLEKMSPKDLAHYEIYEGKYIELHFEGGVVVAGDIITGTRDVLGKILIISFKNCAVTYNDQVLFHPDWGVYDMTIGAEVISAYSGVADVTAFEDIGKVSETKTHKIKYTEEERKLYSLYEKIRHMRESSTTTDRSLSEIFDILLKEFPNDWLLPLEMYELTIGKNFSVQPYIARHLEKLKQNKACSKLINDGLALLNTDIKQNIEWDYSDFLTVNNKEEE